MITRTALRSTPSRALMVSLYREAQSEHPDPVPGGRSRTRKQHQPATRRTAQSCSCHILLSLLWRLDSWSSEDTHSVGIRTAECAQTQPSRGRFLVLSHLFFSDCPKFTGSDDFTTKKPNLQQLRGAKRISKLLSGRSVKV